MEYLPPLLERFTPDRILHSEEEYYLECKGRWHHMLRFELRDHILQQIRQLIAAEQERDPDEHARIKRALSNQARRAPLIQAVLAHLDQRNDEIEWNPRRLLIFKNGNVFDFDQGIYRSPIPSDYVRHLKIHPSVIISTYIPITDADREITRKVYCDLAGDEERGAFLLDVFAYALLGIPPPRVYVLWGNSRSLIGLHSQHVLFPYSNQLHGFYHIGRASRHARVTFSTTPHQHYPLPFDALMKSDTIIVAEPSPRCITDPSIIAATVHIEISEHRDPIPYWTSPIGCSMLSVLCERASKLRTMGPPPLPPSVQAYTNHKHAEWEVTTMEEWIRTHPLEGTRTAHWRIYQAEIDAGRVEKVNRNVFFHAFT